MGSLTLRLGQLNIGHQKFSEDLMKGSSLISFPLEWYSMSWSLVQSLFAQQSSMMSSTGTLGMGKWKKMIDSGKKRKTSRLIQTWKSSFEESSASIPSKDQASKKWEIVAGSRMAELLLSKKFSSISRQNTSFLSKETPLEGKFWPLLKTYYNLVDITYLFIFLSSSWPFPCLNRWKIYNRYALTSRTFTNSKCRFGYYSIVLG